MTHTLLAGAICLAVVCADAIVLAGTPGEREAQAAQSPSGSIEPDEETRVWMQTSLDNWETICRQHLRIDLEPLAVDDSLRRETVVAPWC